MADEPSIDEILASLDRLLKEGEGRNDEPVELAPPAADEAASSPSAHDAPSPHFFEVLDEEAEGSHGDTEAHGIVPDAGADEAVEASEGGMGEAAEVSTTGQDSRLFVLTDAMRIDDQQSLPLEEAASDEDEDMDAMHEALAMPESTEEEPELIAEMTQEEETVVAMPEPEALPPEATVEDEIEAAAEVGSEAPGQETVTWDEADVQALVDQVTDDVCSAMAEALPDMIRRALATRLSAFIDERIPYDGNTESQP